MTISMYQASVPRIVNMLTSLDHLLTKAHTHVESKKWNEAALTQFRLYPDMFPLTRQVQIACDTAKGLVARLAGVEIPAYEDYEVTLADLKQRGLLDSTLVIWAGEFGRTPMMQGNNGRNHNPYGFTIWMAGGGVKAGSVIGSTDEIGLRAAEQPQSIKNLHATILTALGLNPDDLFLEHAGRQERLTGVAQSWKTIPGVLG